MNKLKNLIKASVHDVIIYIKSIRTKEELMEFSKGNDTGFKFLFIPGLDKWDRNMLKNSSDCEYSIENSLNQIWIKNPYKDNCFHDSTWELKVNFSNIGVTPELASKIDAVKDKKINYKLVGC